MNFPLLRFPLLLLFCGFFCHPLFSQTPSAPIGSVIGIVNDSATNLPVEFVVVAVLDAKDSLAKGGGLTDKTGSFIVNQLPAGEYFARVTFIGYKPFFTKHFFISAQNAQTDLGILKLAADKKVLGAVDVVSEKSDYVNNVDKKVYEMGKNLTATGGTAADVLQQIPGVTVDVDGNVSMRGSGNVTILIDGKPSGLTGDDKQAVISQFPASMIERIEVISNPSAQYDAQGMSGIINIITKKDSGKGFNGTATIGAGDNNKYNASVTLSNRSKKLNIYGSYNFRAEEKWGKSGGMQHTFTADTNYYYQLLGGSVNNTYFQNGKAGADIFINPYNTLSFTGSYSYTKELKDDSTVYSFLDQNLSEFSRFQRNTVNDEFTKTMEATSDYKKSFPGSKRMLTVNGSFSGNDKITGNTYANDFLGFENPPYQSSAGDNNFITATGQTDYTHPLNDTMRLEMGLKYGMRHNNNLQVGKTFDYAGNYYFFDPRFSDHFVFRESVYAGYLQFVARVKKVDYQAGVRSEYTDLTGSSSSSASTFTNQYLSFFPSASLRYRMKEGYDFRFSYSRRLNRPNNRQINPFIDYSDSISLRTGNPYLKPEFIQSLETEFVRTWQQSSLSATVYYRHTDNMISMSRIFDPATGIGITMPRNFSTSDNVGADITFRKSLGKKGNVMLSLSGNDSKVNGDNIEAGLQSTTFGWSGKISSYYKITKSTFVQLTASYGSPMSQPLGSFQMPGGVDAGVRQDLFRGKGTFTLNVADIFDTKKMKMRSYNTGYDYSGYRKKESRIVMLSFSWRFGSGDDIRKKGSLPIQQEEGPPSGD
jgi:iron complex outermembrane receptor protein